LCHKTKIIIVAYTVISVYVNEQYKEQDNEINPFIMQMNDIEIFKVVFPPHQSTSSVSAKTPINKYIHTYDIPLTL
jgi:hypothetical protein